MKLAERIELNAKKFQGHAGTSGNNIKHIHDSNCYFKPSHMMQALMPMDEGDRIMSDQYISVKEKFLMERFLLQKEIDKENEK